MKRYSFIFDDKQELFAENCLEESIFPNHKMLYLHLLEQHRQKMSPAYIKQKQAELAWRKQKNKATSSDVETIYRKLESFILPIGFELPLTTLASTYEGTIETTAEWEDNDITFPLEEPMFVINKGMANKNFFYPIKMANHVEPQMIEIHKASIASRKYNTSLEGQDWNQEYWLWRALKDSSLVIEDAIEQYGQEGSLT